MSEGTTGVEEPRRAGDRPSAPPDGPLRADEPRRASALLACGVVVGIAVLVTAGIVAWARLGAATGAAGAQGPEPVEEAVPDTLAGEIELGEVPDAVADTFDGPVVGARLLEEIPDGVDCAHVAGDFAEEPEAETVLVTPDAVHVSLRPQALQPDGGNGGQGQLLRVTCGARWQDGAWVGSGQSMSGADDPATGMTSASCCDADGLGFAEAVVEAPAGAAWVVQDRGGYHLAYPVPQPGTVTIGWRFRETFGRFAGPGGPTPTRVTFVDAGGEVLDELTLRP